MPEAFNKYVKANVIHQTPKLQADVREQRKKESLKMIYYALEQRLKDENSLKP